MNNKKNMNEPIVMTLSEQENFLLYDGEKFPLENGFMFKNDYYGFKLIVNNNELEYDTQARIDGVQIVGDFLCVYEGVKSLPWKFDKKTGAMLNAAAYLKGIRNTLLNETQETIKVYSKIKPIAPKYNI